MKRIAALDFGKARIGVAISDPLRTIALPQKTIQAKKTLETTAAHAWQELLALGSFDTILLGLPLHMNGKESPMSQEVRQFGKILEEQFGAKVIFWDERLTSLQGEKLLREANLKHPQRQKVLDGIAATILLQNYIETCSKAKNT